MNEWTSIRADAERQRGQTMASESNMLNLLGPRQASYLKSPDSKEGYLYQDRPI